MLIRGVIQVHRSLRLSWYAGRLLGSSQANSARQWRDSICLHQVPSKGEDGIPLPCMVDKPVEACPVCGRTLHSSVQSVFGIQITTVAFLELSMGYCHAASAPFLLWSSMCGLAHSWWSAQHHPLRSLWHLLWMVLLAIPANQARAWPPVSTYCSVATAMGL